MIWDVGPTRGGINKHRMLTPILFSNWNLIVPSHSFATLAPMRPEFR